MMMNIGMANHFIVRKFVEQDNIELLC